jgi:hypothetical protein
LKCNDAEVLQNKGKVTLEIAKIFAESDFDKYRVIQHSLCKSDFNKLLEESNVEVGEHK